MSTPFRKESDESLYNRVKDGHVATNLLPQIPEPSFSGEGEEDVAASCGSSSDLLSTLSDPLNDIGMGEVYNPQVWVRPFIIFSMLFPLSQKRYPSVLPLLPKTKFSHAQQNSACY